MTGIMAAVAGGTQNVIYAAGLYRVGAGVDTSPIDFSGSSSGGSSLTYDYTWIGYYRPSATGTVTLGLATSYIEYLDFSGSQIQYNWGGSGYAIGRLWIGATAISGYTTGNANITANNQTTTYLPSLVAGIYYPVRIQMQMYLPYNPFAYQYGFQYYPGYATGSFNFQSGGSTNVTNLIWYNTKTNGF